MVDVVKIVKRSTSVALTHECNEQRFVKRILGPRRRLWHNSRILIELLTDWRGRHRGCDGDRAETKFILPDPDGLNRQR